MIEHRPPVQGFLERDYGSVVASPWGGGSGGRLSQDQESDVPSMITLQDDPERSLSQTITDAERRIIAAHLATGYALPDGQPGALNSEAPSPPDYVLLPTRPQLDKKYKIVSKGWDKANDVLNRIENDESVVSIIEHAQALRNREEADKEVNEVVWQIGMIESLGRSAVAEVVSRPKVPPIDKDFTFLLEDNKPFVGQKLPADGKYTFLLEDREPDERTAFMRDSNARMGMRVVELFNHRGEKSGDEMQLVWVKDGEIIDGSAVPIASYEGEGDAANVYDFFTKAHASLLRQTYLEATEPPVRRTRRAARKRQIELTPQIEHSELQDQEPERAFEEVAA